MTARATPKEGKVSPLIPKLWKCFVDGGAQMPMVVPPDCTIQRTHAGRFQQAAGGWSWNLWSRQDEDAARILMNRGSIESATRVARAKRVSCLVDCWGSAELFVEEM